MCTNLRLWLRSKFIIPEAGYTRQIMWKYTKTVFPDKGYSTENKNEENLGDLIAVTGLVMLLKLDSNRRFF